MKLIKWIGHPLVFTCAYLLFITEGENFGGFYLLYILLALPHGAMYALLAVAGVISLLIGFNSGAKGPRLKPVAYSIGLALMILSILNFFQTGDQSATFNLFVPLASFILLSVCTLFFLLNIILLFQRPRSQPSI